MASRRSGVRLPTHPSRREAPSFRRVARDRQAAAEEQRSHMVVEAEESRHQVVALSQAGSSPVDHPHDDPVAQQEERPSPKRQAVGSIPTGIDVECAHAAAHERTKDDGDLARPAWRGRRRGGPGRRARSARTTRGVLRDRQRTGRPEGALQVRGGPDHPVAADEPDRRNDADVVTTGTQHDGSCTPLIRERLLVRVQPCLLRPIAQPEEHEHDKLGAAGSTPARTMTGS